MNNITILKKRNATPVELFELHNIMRRVFARIE